MIFLLAMVIFNVILLMSDVCSVIISILRDRIKYRLTDTRSIGQPI